MTKNNNTLLKAPFTVFVVFFSWLLFSKKKTKKNPGRQARRKQLESGATKTKEILKTHSRRGFYFFIAKNLILTEKKHCSESTDASAGPARRKSIYVQGLTFKENIL